MSELVGLIPCAGRATRIAPLPCSKELLPVGVRRSAKGVHPVVVSQYLLEKMRAANVRRAHLVIRDGKWDIPSYYGDGSSLGMQIGYHMMGRPFGPPYTMDQAYPFIRGARVAMGFPDILFDPDDAFASAFDAMDATGADVVLGAYPVAERPITDMLDVDSEGWVRDIVIRPAATTLTMTWVFAVWAPSFTEFMHEHLADEAPAGAVGPPELTVGEVIRESVHHGLRVLSLPFPEGRYLDIGTPEGLGAIAAADLFARDAPEPS